ncbi:MAG TPA: hypothetical protein VKE70_08450, partial [Candidatus Solibacter sp.]|nr:hypothetical protein [Candidatus Solibacter sp.]
APSAVQPAAAAGSAVAPNSLASLYGGNLASGEAHATAQPLPTNLGGVMLSVTDSAGVQRSAPLVFVSATQINFVVPDGSAAGTANFTVTSPGGSQTFPGTIQTVAPALFSMNGTGTGVAAATAISTIAGNPGVQSPVTVFQCSDSTCTSVPIALGVDTPIYVTFYGTGIRNASSLSNVSATISGVRVPVLYAGPTPGFTGLDQVNVVLPLTLRGAGESNVLVTADGQTSNAVTINVK